jgi:phage terminase large subunit
MSFWRKEDPEIVDGTVSKGGMFEHQRQWWHSPAYMKVLVAGYGAGKTLISAKRAISVALQNNGSPYLYISPSYKMAKRTIVPHLNTLLDGRGIAYRHNKSDHEFKLKYKGRTGIIWIGSGDDPSSLKGPNVGAINIDEPFIQDRGVFLQAMARVRDPKAVIRELTMTGTPEELNWGFDICEGDEKGRHDLETIHASTLDNFALPKQYTDSLNSGYDERAIDAYRDGKFVILSDGLVYRQFSKLNVIDVDTPAGGNLLVGMDFNVDPMSAGICHEVGNELHQCDEIIIQNSDTPALCKELLRRYPNHTFTVYPDSSGKSRSSKGFTDFSLIKEVLGDRLQSLEYPKKNPYLRDRFNSVNAMMCNSVGERKYFVHPRCKETIADYERTTYPYEDFKRKNPKRTHASDNIGYLIHRRYPAYGKPTIGNW